MLFGTPEFLGLFLPIALAAHFVAGRALRNVSLLLLSLTFYAWGEGAMVLVMLASVVVNWALGLMVGTGSTRTARAVVGLAVVINLGLLSLFKYGRWALGDVAVVQFAESLGKGGGPPIGISFFTFQALSYVIDVYRGAAPAQRSPLRFGLYIALFPQLIAGPIVRYKDVAQQLVERTVSVGGFAEGIRRFVQGLAKKVLIADTLARTVDPIFALEPGAAGAGVAWLGIVAYTLQIYFDFSGYSDMAIGLGRMFGFRFLENFDHPYVARSVTEFWRRWHISLSTWFRDYLYIPLGGNRRGALATYRNLVIVFLLCGLWHGASTVFILWGAFHGLFLVLERVGLGSFLVRCPRALQHAYLLLAVMLGWVLFRADDLTAAMHFGRSLVGAGGQGPWSASRFIETDGLIALAAGLLFATPAPARALARLLDSPRPDQRALGLVGQLVVTVALFSASWVLLSGASSTPFIYLRF